MLLKSPHIFLYEKLKSKEITKGNKAKKDKIKSLGLNSRFKDLYF